MNYGSEGTIHYRVRYSCWDYPTGALVEESVLDVGTNKDRAEWEFGRTLSEYAGKRGGVSMERTLEFPIGGGDTLPDRLELGEAHWERRVQGPLSNRCRLNEGHRGKCAK